MNKKNKTRATISDLIEGAVGPIKGLDAARRAKAKRVRPIGLGEVPPEFSQSEVRHIDHYIDGITVPRRERKPFDPIKYMRGKAA